MVLKESDGTEKTKADKTIADKKENMYEDLFLKGFRSDCTVACYKHSLNLFRSQVTKPVPEITMNDLRKWQSTLCDKPKSRRNIACIKSYMKFLFNQGYTPTNVGRCLTMPPKQEIRIERDISEEKMLQLIHVSTGNTRLMVQFMYYLGIRVSECIKIHMKDITIGTLVKVKIKGKGNKFRICTFGPKTSKKISEKLKNTEGYLFPSKHGTHLTRSGAYRRVKKLMRKIGIEAGSPHWLRHCFATTLLSKQADIKTISVALGHSNITTTSAYLHAKKDGVAGLLE
jgi:integrase/recombinase XerD